MKWLDGWKEDDRVGKEEDVLETDTAALQENMIATV